MVPRTPGGGLKSWLAHPLARNVGLDDVAATERHRAIIAQKPFLKRLYAEWYGRMAAGLPAGEQPVLEVGSGAGFLGDLLPGLVTSDLVPVDGVRVVLDARHLPFGAGSLRAIASDEALPRLRASASISSFVVKPLPQRIAVSRKGTFV